MKITKNRYLMGFAAIVVLLALVRLIFPSVAAPRLSAEEMLNDSTQVELAESKTDKETAESSALNAKVEKDSIKKKLKNHLYPSRPNLFRSRNLQSFLMQMEHWLNTAYGVWPVIKRHSPTVSRFSMLPHVDGALNPFRIVRRLKVVNVNWSM